MQNAANSDNLQIQTARQTAFLTADPVAKYKPIDFTKVTANPELLAKLHSPKDGSLAPATDSVIMGRKSALTGEMESTSYEGIGYMLDSLFTPATPSGTTTYTRNWAAPLTTKATPKFLTVQWGESSTYVTQIQDMAVNTMKLSGGWQVPLASSWSLLGGKFGTGTLQSLANPTNHVMINGCQADNVIYIDDWAGTIGTTAVSGTVFSWELTVNANREFRGYVGECSATSWRDRKWTGQLTLSVELDPTTAAYLTATDAATPSILKKQIRIKHAVDTTKLLQIDFTGHMVTPIVRFQDRDGVVAMDLVFDGVYHPTFTNWLKIQTISAAAAYV